MDKNSKQKTTWRFLEVFILSNGHYFGFESTTIHSWYLTRSTVDIISSISIIKQFYFNLFCFLEVPKTCFKELGYFAPMILEKLRQDFLEIYPNEIFIRNSYIKYLQTNQNEISTIKFTNQNKQSTINSDFRQKIKWIPEENILSMKTFFELLN